MKKDNPKKEISQKLFERVFLPWTAILILLHLVAVYVAPAYLWGVHFYHFFPAWIGWALTLITFALLVPNVGEFLYLRLEAFAEKIKEPFGRLGENKAFVMLSILSLPIFWIFRTRLHLLGDGYFRISDLPEGRFHLQEWLDGFIHLVVYRVMVKLIPTWTPELTYSMVSVLCGGVFIFLALKLSSRLGKTGVGKALIFFFLTSLGSVQLFFGYVESYSILQVALLAYIWFAVLYLSGRVSILPALLVFLLSVGLHVTSLIFFPSFIYLAIRKRKRGSRKETSLVKRVPNAFVFTGLILASLFIIYWVIIVATGLEEAGKGIFILPLVASESYAFGMFSLGHVSEFVNQLLLLSPLGISLVIFFLFFKVKLKEFEDGLANFLILGACIALIYLFVFNFTLGSADWDLRSSPAVFFGLLGGYLFLAWGERRPRGKKPVSENSLAISPPGGKRFRTWCLIFIWFGLFHTVPWILINASHSRSVARYVSIQENDPHPVDETGYNLYKIARLLRLADVPEEEEKLYQRALQRNPYDTLSYFNLAAYYHRNQDLDNALGILDSLLKVDRLYPKANWMVGNIYVKRKEYAKAIPYLERVFHFLEDNSEFLFDLGVSYYSTNQPEKALAAGQQILELTPDYVDAYHLVGLSYFKLGDYEKAMQAWEQLIQLDPNDSVAVNNLRQLQEYLEK